MVEVCVRERSKWFLNFDFGGGEWGSALVRKINGTKLHSVTIVSTCIVK